ncbi:hypothetical protein OnM2_065031 [Erysiphe neolycopersici]|uniref:Uncharacterized protein n=1 Tax=Erysiphe neolycopersici TaxID=212602 RepID=A0A420HMQ4_9PEZI|nr:hypothetical protein OnM2_065031 [Erysiphe neolycopersici]
MAAELNTSPSIAHVAAERLWKFQLRKENKAILDELQDHENKRKSLLETNQKRFEAGEERILKLEAKIVQLEQEHNKKMEAWEKFKNEQRAQTAELKMQIRLFLQTRGILTEDEICKIMMDRVSMSSLENRAVVSSRRAILKTQNLVNRNSRSHCPTTNEEAVPQVTEVGLKAKAKEIPITKYQDTRRERKAIKQTIQVSRPTNTVEESKLPRLSQGRVQLKLYYEQADSIRSSSDISEEQLETEFVNSFIKGISNYKAREKLTGQLQQIHPSKQKKDGRVEILCSWAELGEAIKTFSSYGEKKPASRSKKQRTTTSRGPVQS